MLTTIETYQDVLSENTGRHSVIGSGWMVYGLLGLLVVIFI